jgi:type I restriction enzyme S subunit
VSNTKFKPYEQYQKKVHEWLGELPLHWELKRVGYYFSERREKVSDKDFEPLSVTKNGILPQLESAAKSDDGDNRKLVRKGDYVINSRSDRKGSSGLSSFDGSVSLINTVITPSDSIYGPYIHNLFRSTPFQEEYYRFGKGIVADLWTTNYSEFKNIMIPIPPFEEQKKIAFFLERETAIIDELIQKQQELIKLSICKRGLTINEYLLRGIDRAAELIDSHNELMGFIPRYWAFNRLKYSISINPSYKELGAVDDEMQVPFFAMESIGENGSLDMSVSRKFSDISNAYTYFKNGDVVVAKVTPCFENFKGALIRNLSTGFGFGTTELVVLRPNQEIDGEYLYYISISPIVRDIGASFMTGAGGLKRVPDEFFLNLRWPIPDIENQKLIVRCIKQDIQKIDLLILKSEESIQLLKEHRASLISAAVTGKIKVF